MMRHVLFATLCLGAWAFAQESRPPNVLVILSDDQGAGDLSLHGNPALRTPNLDSLARDGVSLTQFFVQPVCAPTRAEFLTGRYHPRGGVRGVTRGAERLDADEVTIADVFRAAGHATAAFGKWHNGTQAPYHPLSRGFERFYGFTHGHLGQYFDPLLDEDGEPVRAQGYVADLITDRLLEFIDGHAERPFFALLAFNTPHSPMQVPDVFFDRQADRPPARRGTNASRFDPEHTRAAYAMVENLDWNVGRVLARLRELDLESDTVVVFFSDNGPNGHRDNLGLRGIKGSTDDGGVRSPLFVRWPERVPAGASNPTLAGAIDLLPTLADLAGVEIPEAIELDGASVAPVLLGEVDRIETGVRIAYHGGRVSARSATHRLDHRGRLYDMRADAGQQTPLEAPSAELEAAVAAWRKDVLGTLAETPRPFTVGYPPLRTTELPARDASLAGALRRSSRHPNDSYVLNWTRADDALRWPIQLARGGRFAVSLGYVCPAADVGSRMRLDGGAEPLEFRITAPHAAEPVGAAADRTARTESYVKDFGRARVGEIELGEGLHDLILRAVDIPGSQALEFFSLYLERLD